MNEVLELTKMHDEVRKLTDQVKIDNPTDNPLVDAYNDGVEAMTNQVLHYLNSLGLQKAFGGEQ